MAGCHGNLVKWDRAAEYSTIAWATVRGTEVVSLSRLVSRKVWGNDG